VVGCFASSSFHPNLNCKSDEQKLWKVEGDFDTRVSEISKIKQQIFEIKKKYVGEKTLL